MDLKYRVENVRTQQYNYYLAAQLEVRCENGDLGAADYQNDEDDKKEAEKIVELSVPNSLKWDTLYV